MKSTQKNNYVQNATEPSAQFNLSIKNLASGNFTRSLAGQKVKKFLLRLQQWKRDLMLICNDISEEETLAIFIDSSHQKKLQLKQVTEELTGSIINSLTHKFMTPVASIKSIIHYMRLQPLIIQLSQNQNTEPLVQCIIACEESILVVEQLIKNLKVYFL